MAGPYMEIECGLFVNGNEVTLTEEFRWRPRDHR
jgi:hypothetical protein